MALGCFHKHKIDYTQPAFSGRRSDIPEKNTGGSTLGTITIIMSGACRYILDESHSGIQRFTIWEEFSDYRPRSSRPRDPRKTAEYLRLGGRGRSRAGRARATSRPRSSLLNRLRRKSEIGPSNSSMLHSQLGEDGPARGTYVSHSFDDLDCDSRNALIPIYFHKCSPFAI